MYRYVKRAIDVVFASVALVVLCPLFVFVPLYIKLESRGPTLTWQRRVGKDRKDFRLARFRTMQVSGDGFSIFMATNSDARTTRTGQFVRRTGLVNLPTLWNIVRGDMSFIGPRPLMPQVDGEVRAAYPTRSDVRPGLFTPERLHGLAGELLSIEEMKQVLQWDDDYVKRQSLLLDLRILFSVFRPRRRELDHGRA